ncbi:MAG: hypothetical protein QM657_01715 [Lacrimispora sp.]|uniref:hypothetical protein n=1 Tax=Lacrimispora sp. TaxID=2719234 RepID=UPI0039E22D7D
MDLIYYDSTGRVLYEKTIYEYLTNTFRAFADAIIPRSPELAQQYGRVQYYGALDLYTGEFIILSLDSLVIPLALPVAETLNMAAEQFLYRDEEKAGEEPSGSAAFLSLSPMERLQVISMLFYPEGIAYFPALEQASQKEIFLVISSLTRLSMMGYYSEWAGYGSTRMNPPNQRRLEYYPESWAQVGYPGPSAGYRLAGAYSYT